MSSVQMIGYCITRYQMSVRRTWDGSVRWPGVVHRPGRQGAERGSPPGTRQVRAQLGSDSLHGAHLDQSTREFGEGDMAIQCVIKERACAGSRTSTPAPSTPWCPAMTDELRQAMAALGAAHPRELHQPGATSDLSIDEALLLHSIGWSRSTWSSRGVVVDPVGRFPDLAGR